MQAELPAYLARVSKSAARKRATLENLKAALGGSESHLYGVSKDLIRKQPGGMLPDYL